MFRVLMNFFPYQRTALQALGWYLTFLLIGLILAGVAGLIFVPGPAEGAQRGIPVGQWVIIAYDLVLAVALLWTRWRSAVNILLALVGLLLAVLLGALGGLIPLAVLTTRPSYKSPGEIGQVFE
jgi:hypothetical protein